MTGIRRFSFFQLELIRLGLNSCHDIFGNYTGALGNPGTHYPAGRVYRIPYIIQVFHRCFLADHVSLPGPGNRPSPAEILGQQHLADSEEISKLLTELKSFKQPEVKEKIKEQVKEDEIKAAEAIKKKIEKKAVKKKDNTQKKVVYSGVSRKKLNQLGSYVRNIENTAQVVSGNVVNDLTDPTNSVNISAPREIGMSVSFNY